MSEVRNKLLNAPVLPEQAPATIPGNGSSPRLHRKCEGRPNPPDNFPIGKAGSWLMPVPQSQRLFEEAERFLRFLGIGASPTLPSHSSPPSYHQQRGKKPRLCFS